MCACGGQRTTSGSVGQAASTLFLYLFVCLLVLFFILRQYRSLALDCPNRPVGWPMSLRDLLVSASPAPGILTLMIVKQAFGC